MELKWTFRDSNPGPTGYEPVALTNWAKGPYAQTCLDISFAVTYFYMTANHVLAPQVGLEPTTLWLTVRCSTDWAIEEYWSDLSSLQIALCRHRPIFPGRHQPSIVSVNELNYRVRNGNGCTLITINTYCVLLSKNLCYYNTFAVLCQEKKLVTRGRIELPCTAWEAVVLAAWPTGHFHTPFNRCPEKSGTPSGIRTQDPLIKSQLLYQLS